MIFQDKISRIFFYAGIALIFLFVGRFLIMDAYAAFTCSVTTSAGCTGTVILRMSSSSNAHAELPSQSTPAYDANVVCCSGVVGLGNSCSGTFGTVLKLSSTTNAHAEQNSQLLYATSACISAPGGNNILIGYQASNCSGFDTTLASMSGVTNAHVGASAAYGTKICASVSLPTVSCSTNITSTNLGGLTSGSISTASPNASTTMSCSGGLGCTLTVQDDGNGSSPGLATTSPAYLIPSANATLVAGTEGYGIQATTTNVGSGGSLVVNTIYNKTGNVVGGLLRTGVTLASSTAAVTGREVLVGHLAAIGVATQIGSYSDIITYSCVGN